MYQSFLSSFSIRLFLSVIGMLYGSSLLAIVDPPELRCVSVDSTGKTTLTWISPADPGNEFINYDIYVSSNINGPYSSSSASGLGTTNFTDIVNNASLISYYYYIQTVYDDGSGPTSSVSSDTGKTILPVFTTVTDSTSVVDWNPIFVPDLATSSGIYNVYRRIGNSGPYTNIGSTNYGAESFNDAFKFCSETVYYRIEISDASGCVSSSARLSGLFEDNTPPKTPFLDSITVDNVARQVNLGWKPSSSLDTYGYMIFYWVNATSSLIVRDTVIGRNNTFYAETLSTIDPYIGSEQFTVTSIDSCRNTPASANAQKTIHLKVIPNNCENTVTLNWTPYINWDDIEQYEVMVSVNGNPFQTVLTLPPSDTTYTHQKTDQLAIYCYKIRVVNTRRTRSSTSNIKCSIANSLIIPAQQYFKQITVEDNKSIRVVSLTDTSLPASQYALYRSLERFDNFYEVTRVPFENKPIIELNDYEVSVDQTSYFYRIGILDTCGSVIFISRPSNSMLLQGSMEDDSLRVSLNWTPYNSWDSVGSGVGQYVIYRIADGNRVAVDSVDRFSTSYQYVLNDDVQLGSTFCFEIEARENEGNKYDMQDSALSNQVCFTRNLNVYVPNAFRPQGINNVFYPVISFGDVSNYRMIIYDRWGGQIFETTDIYNGWDGTIDGSDAGFGAYVYFIQVSNFTGATYTKQGTFVLLR